MSEKNKAKQKKLEGSYTAVILPNAEEDLPKIQAEYAAVVAKVKPEDKNFDRFSSHADSYFTSFVRTTPAGSNEDGGAGKIMMIIALIVLLFMLLPVHRPMIPF